MALHNQLKIGEVSVNTNGTPFKVLGYVTKRKVAIEFIDEFKFRKVIDSWEVRRGNASNPFDKVCFGVGYNGIGKYSPSKDRKVKEKWIRMLSRCYDKSANNPSYDGCTVEKSWHNFQNFAEWFYKEVKPFEGTDIAYEIDKDLLSGELTGKLYSKDTCCILPKVINANVSVGLKSGVVVRGNSYFSHNSFHGEKKINGPFSSYEEASKFYVDTKVKIYKTYLEEYREFLTERVVVALNDNIDKFLRRKSDV